MQTLNCLVALAGDPRHTVPKTGITVAEAHMLRTIHGSEALLDVQPLDLEVKVSPGSEFTRLAEQYRGRDGDGKPLITTAFAAGGVGMPQDIVDLDLPETAFKVLSRTIAAPKPKKGKAVVVATTEEPDGNALFDE